MTVVSLLKTGTYAVTRIAAGTYTDGIWVEGSPSALNLDACVQPLRGRALQNLPEGKLASDLRKVYCDSELRTVNESDGTSADQITIGGDLYEIIESEPWTSGMTGRAYWKALAERVVGS